MAMVALGLLCVVGVAVGAPATFDQRQQGELNIHAQLDNIVIVLIPTSNLNLLELTGKTRYSGEKPGITDKGSFLQIFQKPHKTDIDRYETIKDVPDADSSTDSQNDIKAELIVPVVSSQQVALTHEEQKGDKNEDGEKGQETEKGQKVENNEEERKEEKNEDKEEEVVAIVQEMKPEAPEKATDAPKSEATEDTPLKEHSTVSETMQETVLKLSIPEKLNDETEEDSKELVLEKNLEKHSDKATEQLSPHSEKSESSEKIPESSETLLGSVEKSDIKESTSELKEEISQEEKLKVPPPKVADSSETTIEDLIKPVAATEEHTLVSNIPKKTAQESVHSPQKKTAEPVKLVEGVRKEKVIRYKPETKWAPGLVDLLGPPKPRELEERQRFASLCTPGVWDSELKTCIMPGETRSRNELARFLEAMRFGIAIPTH